MLSEFESYNLLKQYGVPVPDHAIVQTAAEAARAAEKIGFPVVMKIHSPQIVHKSDAGGVIVSIGSKQAAEEAFDRIVGNAKAYNPEAEIKGVIGLVGRFYSLFGFKYHVELSTRPDNAMGTEEIWETATSALRQALEALRMPYAVNEGDGAFYGPKIDFHLEDSLGRTWQCGTIQLDFLMPEKFDLNYIGEDGQKHRPVMIHRVVFGSIERFIGILIEHYGGAFPVWLAPMQVRVLPITDRHNEYAYRVKDELVRAGIRAEVNDRNDKIGYKIRAAQVEQIPYMLVVGDKEATEGMVAVRERRAGDTGSVPLAAFIQRVKKEITERR